MTPTTAHRTPVPGPHFDELAEPYTALVEAMDRDGSPVRALVDRVLTGGARLLDVGCGIGQFCRLLAPRYAEVLGVDVSARMVEGARARTPSARVRYVHGDALDLDPDRDGRFDAVLVTNVAFHLGPPAVVLPRLRSLVAPGGTLLVVDVVEPDGPRGGDGDDERRRVVFETARAVHEMSGDVEAAIASIRLMLHPRWIAMSAQTAPLPRAEFAAAYAEHLPGVRLDEQLVPELAVAVWRAPAAPPSPHPVPVSATSDHPTPAKETR